MLRDYVHQRQTSVVSPVLCNGLSIYFLLLIRPLHIASGTATARKAYKKMQS